MAWLQPEGEPTESGWVLALLNCSERGIFRRYGKQRPLWLRNRSQPLGTVWARWSLQLTSESGVSPLGAKCQKTRCSCWSNFGALVGQGRIHPSKKLTMATYMTPSPIGRKSKMRASITIGSPSTRQDNRDTLTPSRMWVAPMKVAGAARNLRADIPCGATRSRDF